MRFQLAVLAAKLSSRLIQTLNLGGGTSYPGWIAQRIDHDVLSKLNQQLTRGSIFITGTNGKTTTTTLIRKMLEQSGHGVVHNKTGANLMAGITVSFLRNANLFGTIHKEAAVIETDEGIFPQLCEVIQPELVVVTNFFRDQLDRYGELDKTISYIRLGLTKLPVGSKVLLNADDPMVVGLSGIEGLQYFYFGINDPNMTVDEMHQIAEGKFCPRCGTMLEYQHYYFSHMGDYSCPNCGFHRPQPHFWADEVKLKGLLGSTVQLSSTSEPAQEIRSSLPGLYNIYNLLAAYAAAGIFGVSVAHRAKSIEEFQSVFGRMERIQANGKEVIMALVKNPTGWNEVMRTLFQHQGKYHLFIALNDQIPDGTDVSWIWDADAEQLLACLPSITGFTISGSRAYDMAVRLKYAGLDIPSNAVETDLERAWELAYSETDPDETLVIVPNYTAMLHLQAHMAKQGFVKPYWEENI